MNHTLKYFSLIGSGFAANFFAAYLPLLGLKPAHIWSRKSSNKLPFFEEAFALQRVQDLKEVTLPQSLVLLCTPDNSIAEISANLPAFDGLLAHCSGASPLNDLNLKHKHRAVLWPMASLSSVDKSLVGEVFLSIEDNSDTLPSLFSKTSLPYGIHTSSERLKLHLAAVLANNFTHHLMYHVAQLSEQAQVPFDIFKQLALQALKPHSTLEFFDTQTGPSKRGDFSTVHKHEQILNPPELKALYNAFHQSIKKTYGTEL